MYRGDTSQFYHEDTSLGVSGLVTRKQSVPGNVVFGFMFWRPAAGSGEMLSLHIKSGGKSYIVGHAIRTTLKPR
jgi:hypothetical protein